MESNQEIKDNLTNNIIINSNNNKNKKNSFYKSPKNFYENIIKSKISSSSLKSNNSEKSNSKNLF